MSSTSSRKRLSASADDAGSRPAAGPGAHRIERSTLARSSVWTEFHQYGHTAMASHMIAWRITSRTTNSTSSHTICESDAAAPSLNRSNSAFSTRPVSTGKATTITHSEPPR